MKNIQLVKPASKKMLLDPVISQKFPKERRKGKKGLNGRPLIKAWEE